ncbi:MAG: hypothetical protein ACKVQQ_08545 [Burkholderiales bacterium]
MLEPQHIGNAFALISDPTTIANAIEQSRRWQLKSRVCRPLDRPARSRISRELAQFDAMIEKESATASRDD